MLPGCDQYRSTKVVHNALIATAVPGQTINDKGSRDSVKGLHVRVFEGRKVFYLYYRTLAGTQRRPRIGDYGVMTISQARQIARDMLHAVAAGRDPSLERRDRREELTIDELFALCWNAYWSKDRFTHSGWGREVKKHYARNIGPTFGHLQISEVTPDRVKAWHDSFSDKPFSGNRALSVLSRLMHFAEVDLKPEEGRRDPQSNPCRFVKPFKERSRERYATGEEIKKIGALLEKEASRGTTSAASVAFLYILIYTGMRMRGVARATWEQLERKTDNGETFGILRYEGKAGPEIAVLPPQAMRVIDTLPQTPKGTITGIQEPRSLWRRIRKQAGCNDLWARDWRRTFATVGMSGGQDMAVISQVLNHRSTQTTLIYAKLMQTAKIASTSKIANQMEELLKPA